MMKGLKEKRHDFIQLVFLQFLRKTLTMKLLRQIWRSMTHTKALDLSSGYLETIFFETVYRVTYLSGFSLSDRNKGYFVYSCSLKFLTLMLIYGELWHFFTIPCNLDEIIESFNIIILQCSAMYKYRKFVSNRDNFKNLAASMESPYFDVSTPGRKKMLEEWQQRNELYLRIILGFGTGALLAWHTYPLVDDLDFNLMIPIRLPYDYGSSLLYPITYTVVLILFSNVAYFVMLNDLILQAHVMHLLCQFDVLNDCFRNILQDCCEERQETNSLDHNLLFMTEKYKERYIKRLDNLIKQHQKILNNVLTLETLLSGPMLAQLGVSTTIISFIGYQVATDTDNYTKSLMSLLFLGYNMSVLYIICRWCEEIKMQSEKIREAVYCSGWERGAAFVFGVRSRLLLIITRANKPLVISAGGMYDLSLASYSNIIKTSYSALTLLLRLRHD